MALYLTEANVGSLLTPADALEAVEGSFRRLAAGEIENRPRERLRLEDDPARVRFADLVEAALSGTAVAPAPRKRWWLFRGGKLY